MPHEQPTGGSVAIIGAGGGRQVRYAQRFGFRKILGIEIEPAVIEAIRGPFLDAFDRVDEAPGVEVKVAEARSFMEKTTETFDLIYLPRFRRLLVERYGPGACAGWSMS